MLPSDAFVWQRVWRPAVRDALAGGAPYFATWHVLAAEWPADGPPVLTDADWPLLLAHGHAAVPVIRIEGRIDGPRIALLANGIRGVLAAHAMPNAVLEIDHDAATSRLADYTGFLHAMRAVLPSGTRLWITALPSWIAAPGFPALAEAVDRLVLQVHAIDDPRLGLFSAPRALGFVRALTRRTRTPCEVALPAYGARVSDRSRGLSVSSEQPASDARPGLEIAADPVEVARFVAELERDPPDRLVGLVWFRLPVQGDVRAWGMSTLLHVARGSAPDGRAVVATRPVTPHGARQIVVSNAGGDDVALPRQIALPQDCLAADGLGQYVLEPGRLSLRGAGLLGGGASVLAGWMRCSGDVHADH